LPATEPTGERGDEISEERRRIDWRESINWRVEMGDLWRCVRSVRVLVDGVKNGSFYHGHVRRMLDFQTE